MNESGFGPSHWSPRCLAAVALVFAMAAVAAAPSPAPATPASGTSAAHADERARIAQERSAAEARFHARERECRERFIVTSCVDDAKAERRQTLDRLRARQVAVDEARRHQRADERKAELAEKAAEDARRDSAHAAHAAASGASPAASQSGRPFEVPRPQATKSARSAAGGSHERARPSTIGGKARPQESPAARQQREAANRAAYEARREEALAHRNETIERTTKRLAHKAPAAPLQLPPATAASASPVTPRP